MCALALVCVAVDAGTARAGPIAQESGGDAIPGGTLTLSGALEAASEHFEGYALAGVEAERAEALRRLALSSLLPKVTLQGLYSSYDASSDGLVVLPKDNVTTSGALSLTLFSGPAAADYRASRLTEKATLAQLDRDVDLLSYQVAEAFYTALAADRQVSVRERALEAAGESLRVARQRESAGVALPVAVARAELEAAREKAALEAARVARVRSRAALAYYLGTEVLAELTPPPPPALPVADEDQLARDALEHRADLTAQKFTTGAAKLEVDRAWTAYLPTLSLTGSFRATPFPNYLSPEPLTAQFGLRLDFTLYDGGAREADIQLKRAALRASSLAQQELTRRIELEVRQARLQLDSAEAQLAAHEEAVRAARVNYEAVAAQQQAGRATPVEVADATAARAEAEVQRVLGTLTRDLYRLELRRALGLPPLEREGN